MDFIPIGGEEAESGFVLFLELMDMGGRASLPRRGPQTRTGQTPPPANQMMNWLFKYYVTALPGGSAPPP